VCQIERYRQQVRRDEGRVRMVSAQRSISGRGVELAAMATPKAASTTGAAASSRRILFSFAVQSILAK
ncbi:MAG TPA: hypothetical protein PLR59_07205, partial [Brevundimonas sp.]|nr:hypothetical protein [Brevundimonas sp.]